MIYEISFRKYNYFTSDFIKQCKQNPNFPQLILKETKNIIKINLSLRQILLKGFDDPEFYSEYQGHKGSFGRRRGSEK